MRRQREAGEAKRQSLAFVETSAAELEARVTAKVKNNASSSSSLLKNASSFSLLENASASFSLENCVCFFTAPRWGAPGGMVILWCWKMVLKLGFRVFFVKQNVSFLVGQNVRLL